VNFLPARAPAITAANIGFKARFIDIHDIRGAAFGNDAAQCAQIGYPLFRIAFFVFERLFLCVSFMAFRATLMALG